MDASKLDFYMMANHKYFPAEKLMYLKEKLKNVDDERFSMITFVELKDPTTMLMVSIFLGGLGVDRFLMGDVGMGVLKLLTGGLCGILYLYDAITVMNRVKEQNFTKVMTLL